MATYYILDCKLNDYNDTFTSFKNDIFSKIIVEFNAGHRHLSQIDDFCDTLIKKQNVVQLSLFCTSLNNNYSGKIIMAIKKNKSIKTLHIYRQDLSFSNLHIYHALNNMIENCIVVRKYDLHDMYENYDLNMIEEKCRFNRRNNRVPIYMMMLQKRADCVVHLLPRRVLMYLLGFINSRWI